VDSVVSTPGRGRAGGRASAGQAALVLGLELVVELLADALAQLAEQARRVEAGRHPAQERQAGGRGAQVGLHRLAMPGYCTLIATSRPSRVTPR
jgi:hypothetical protein